MTFVSVSEVSAIKLESSAPKETVTVDFRRAKSSVIAIGIGRSGYFTMDDILEKYGEPTYTDRSRRTKYPAFYDYSVYADGKRAENQKCIGGFRDTFEHIYRNGLASGATVLNRNCWVVLSVMVGDIQIGRNKVSAVTPIATKLDYPIDTYNTPHGRTLPHPLTS